MGPRVSQLQQGAIHKPRVWAQKAVEPKRANVATMMRGWSTKRGKQDYVR